MRRICFKVNHTPCRQIRDKHQFNSCTRECNLINSLNIFPYANAFKLRALIKSSFSYDSNRIWNLNASSDIGSLKIFIYPRTGTGKSIRRYRCYSIWNYRSTTTGYQCICCCFNNCITIITRIINVISRFYNNRSQIFT